MPLYVVATPVGNLEDVTLRALDALRECDVIACEDTRVTRRLLDRHGIRAKRLVSYHEHNEKERAPELAGLAASGKSVALVTNAGTPLVSDPGFRLVQACLEAGVEVVPVPGASSVLAALVASGLPTHRFTFLGYLPRKGGPRKRALQGVAEFDGSIVIYEAPQRLASTLEDAAEVLGDRRACLAREVTKLHEEFVRGTLPELAERYAEAPPKGECTVVIAGKERAARPGG
ncbi:MAG: 16S rRNA (cytidine(1402)-2'-O)-methyltransferase [Planctomycetota bacterium]|jgi:16S rRNA (cytidine1402-2'-O)-methyltransferase